VELKKLTDYGIVIIAIGLALGWMGYPGDFLITIGLLIVFIGIMLRFGILKQK
jgi:hypothetical protein